MQHLLPALEGLGVESSKCWSKTQPIGCLLQICCGWRRCSKLVTLSCITLYVYPCILPCSIAEQSAETAMSPNYCNEAMSGLKADRTLKCVHPQCTSGRHNDTDM